ncbi:UDP-3-O-acyl-N-acetylglucosamine deacetylase [Planctomicrobium piriforme]|uniref:UDP-3-O-acyl-N-acetylglucosamine deacetylase n=1 Tax=Planctomicrobium piriforme TaxID=1576369 RepID=A0A1I3IKJ8_9PLAN|nr:UDP-3-O-acyl-N-acetylglucosamine deacetylase [Planctomicrobium piriforme]SFI48452.1 UDP-3-O-[3-hydroxymyristoyl] N-acetylglucosamine deacetylase/UDP-3-O-[3-hydroxymyristoyl] N-acetylglucosamine deacetylase / 3-hydroxyacyl-[acyl-carrier-protein] dehydratase [Planctomicrobium piriforme]
MSQPAQRRQQTIARPVAVTGFGLFHGADVKLEFCPAPCDHGIVFERVDLAAPVRIPALVEYVTPQERCTVITHQGASVAVIEHVMAALAGLQVDNCLVRINALEPPICDGSALAFVEALLDAEIVEQDQLRKVVRIEETSIQIETDRVGIAVQPARNETYQIGFILDFGPGPIPFQSLNVTVTPASFQTELAACRTFVLQHEAEQLQKAGLARRATHQNALVFGPQGILGNALRRPDECVRHKILDCVGDFALLGCDIIGRFTASRSGHRLNHEIIRQIRAGQAALAEETPSSAFAGHIPSPAADSLPSHHLSSAKPRLLASAGSRPSESPIRQ